MKLSIKVAAIVSLFIGRSAPAQDSTHVQFILNGPSHSYSFITTLRDHRGQTYQGTEHSGSIAENVLINRNVPFRNVPFDSLFSVVSDDSNFSESTTVFGTIDTTAHIIGDFRVRHARGGSSGNGDLLEFSAQFGAVQFQWGPNNEIVVNGRFHGWSAWDASYIGEPQPGIIGIGKFSSSGWFDDSVAMILSSNLLAAVPSASLPPERLSAFSAGKNSAEIAFQSSDVTRNLYMFDFLGSLIKKVSVNAKVETV